jgi:hypothetical protein
MNMNADRIKRVIDDLKHCDGHHRNIGVYTFDNAIEAIEKLRKERDEARREICENDPRTISVAAYAKNRGWYCFEEEKTDGK